jgi:hypothetical protein
MTPYAPTFPVRPEHVAALVRPVLQKPRSGIAVGIHAAGPWTGEDHVAIDGQAHPLERCDSELAFREALDRQAERGGPQLIVLTAIGETDLALDVRARLVRQRLLEMQPWTVVAELFRTRDVDPRLTPHGWIAEALLEGAPPEGYPPLPGAVLDADTAWQHVLGRTLGLRTGRPDADALLEASTDPAFAARYDALPDRAREAVAARLADTGGRLGELLARALDAGRGRTLLPLGLACEVVYPDGDAGGVELARAAARLEVHVGAEDIDPGLGRRWAASALRVLERQESAAAVHPPAEALLREFGAEPLVGLSTVLPASYERRLNALAGAISTFLAEEASPAEVHAALAHVEAHRQAHAAGEAARRARLHMALRLVRYLDGRRRGAPPAPRTLGAAAAQYAEEGSYADWARTHLLGGEQAGALAAALEGISQSVRTQREEENRRFAGLLAEWHRTPGAEPGVVAVERIVDEVVAPAAAQGPVLLLLLDGMSYASFRQLHASFTDSGWQEWHLPGRPSRALGLASSPSITRVSRATLFAGSLAPGAAGDERRELARHPALALPGKQPPRLFHKGELTEGASAALAEGVRDALRDPNQHVVAVVLNVLDDSLARSDQALPLWTADRIRLLEPLLFEARLAGRLLVATSDHGHVLDAGTVMLPGGEEERWRPYAEPLAPEEIVLAGPRIQAAVGTGRIVVPWSERVRYVGRRAGYHGGATPQEMLVPLAVLAPWDRTLEGWTVAAEQPPRWWSPEAAPAPAAESAAAPAPRKKPRAAAAQPSLFADAAEPAPPPAPADWIAGLLATDTYGAQRAMAGRVAQPDAVVRAFLELLERHHGRAPRSLLGAALGVPEIRVRGLLAGLQRLLNVDGYPVVSSDEATDTVELNRDLLRRQFGVEERR